MLVMFTYLPAHRTKLRMEIRIDEKANPNCNDLALN